MALDHSGTSTESSRLLLPLGTINVPSLSKRLNYDVSEGRTTIADGLWGEMFKDGKLMTKNYPFILRQVIKDRINNTCQIIFKYAKYLKNNKILIKAVCNHINCKKFKIYLEKDKQLSVFSENINYCHLQNLTMQVRGIERSILKENWSM